MTKRIITEPGIYSDLPMDRYHEQCCDAPSVSSSGLRTIEQLSSAHFYAGWSGNPDYESKKTKSLSLGSAAHALLLGDEAFEERHVVQPFNDYSTNEEIDGVLWKAKVAAKDSAEAIANGELIYKSTWRDKLHEAHKIIVTTSDLEKIKGMAETLQPFEDVFRGDLEQSVFWKEQGIWIKSRLDVRPVDDTLVDYKTTISAHPSKCRRTIFDYRYDMQLALGGEALFRAVGHKINCYMLLFQESSPPYAVTPIEMDPSAIDWAARQNRRAIDVFANNIKLDEWPGYVMPRPIYTPDWITTRLITEEKDCLLPDTPAWLEGKRA